MNNQESELFDKIRQQFDAAPYPRNPLEHTPKGDANYLFIHNLVTPYYLRNQKVIETEGKVVLDAGCGTGYTSLVLAEANPGAKIVGIDLSENSVKLARKRLQYHGFDNAEFHAIAIEDVPSLGIQFDAINTDEVLYLLPDSITGLRAMQSVLKPEGIIRANLHSYRQRFYIFQAQKLFQLMGLMQDNPQELEIELVRETMRSLKAQVVLKNKTWDALCEEDDGEILLNYLLRGDKGYTIPEMFSALNGADLEFIGMVNWRQWELMDLFEQPDDLPAFLAMSLPDLSVEERLHLFELLHPVHRLLDFWCGHPNTAQPFRPIAEWTELDWQGARVHLHPQLRTARVREDLLDSIANRRPFEISRYITSSTHNPIYIESNMAACLLPLWEKAQSVTSLVERWRGVRPVDPITLEPVTETKAFDEIQELLSKLEVFLYLLLESSESP